jgi:beta-mannanase
MSILKRRVVAVATAAVVALGVGVGVASGAGTSQAITCNTTYDGATLTQTCPIPQTTVTVPTTVNNTVTQTVTSTVTANPTTSTPTTTTTATGTPVLSATVDEQVVSGTNKFAYTGSSWTNCGGCDPTTSYQNGFKYAYTSGDKTVFTFTGAQVKMYGIRGPGAGIASVSIDGGTATDADLYQAGNQVPGLYYTSPVLTQGVHTATVSNTGRKNAASSDSTITVDKAEVYSFSSGGTSTTPTTPTTPTTSAGGAVNGAWYSGSSNNSNVAQFGTWRGRSVEIGGQWANTDNPSDNVASPDWGYGSGTQFATTPRMDFAVGALFNGESWASAATGAYDARWTAQLKNMKTAWGSRTASNFFIRFAHEMNGTWYPWQVDDGQQANFIASWKRYYNLVQANFPGAKLVWCPNAGTTSDPAHGHTHTYGYPDELWPGDAYVDVVGVDSYNRDPWVNDTTSFNNKMNSDSGMETYRVFAQQHNKPMAISEWANASVNNGGGGGDAPNFFQLYHDWLVAHGSTNGGAGTVLYEVNFDVPGFGDHYELYDQGTENPYSPNSVAKYKQLW